MPPNAEAAALAELKVNLADQQWRLTHLYWIQDEHGKETKFAPNEPQLWLWLNRWYGNIILKARQLGFSTFILLIFLDTCVFNSNTAAGIIDLTMFEAEKKLGKIKFAYDRMPQAIRDAVPLIKSNSREMIFANGSTIQAGTSHRGGTNQLLHISEFGPISARAPKVAKEIKAGAFGTVHAGQQIFVESTSEGSGGEFYDMVQRAESDQKLGKALSKLDFKLHFFAWWRHEGYTLDPSTVTVPQDMVDYFAELQVKHGIKLKPGQMAWYVAQRRRMGDDAMFKNFPSTPEEAFFASLEGAYFKRQMSKIRLDKRICHLPIDESKPVNTFWDIGKDTTAIWFHQTDGVRHRLVDYYENSGEVITHYCRELIKIRDKRQFVFGKHLGPHDFGVADWGGEGKTRKERAFDLGFEIEAIPRVQDKDDSIDECRIFLGLCWFDEEHTKRGIECLDNYTKKWNEDLSVWGSQPEHNWACHGADSLQTGAMGFSHEPIFRQDGRRSRGIPDSQRSAWGA